MPFDRNSPKKAAKKSQRGAAKKEVPSNKEKMEMLYEKVLEDLCFIAFYYLDKFH